MASRGADPAADGVAAAKAIGLSQDSVVVFIGGARGITPWFARALAAASRCRLELAGRTALPEGPEDPDIINARDASALRAALAGGGMRSPAEIERAARGVLAGREVAATMAELTGLGSQVRYHQLDVRDAESVHSLMGQFRHEYGRIDGLIYVAGVIEDRLLANKDPDSFTRVYRTKANGARTVLAALDETGLTPASVILFGSTAAFGSRGQGDYAAANDALEHIGARWAGEVDGRRCLTVHWGPWAPIGEHSGMVTPHLARDYARRGIQLIYPEEGAASLLRELAWGGPDLTSVIYTGEGW
jgi:NAD(P)-dependent dehydrogenase (short-subunit alcohol dehydrogenase family)